MERDFKGIWIPKEIWLNEDLTLEEKGFLVEINVLDNGNGCRVSDEYFSKFFQIQKNKCSEIINALEKKGFIEVWHTCEEGVECIEKYILIKLIRSGNNEI